MKFSSRLLSPIFAGTILLISNVSAAPPTAPAFYGSVDVGYGYVDYRMPGDLHNAVPGATLNRGNLMWGGNVGVLFMPSLGIDFGYLKFPDVGQKGTGTTGDSFLVNNNMFTLALKGIIYGEYGINLFGKAGVARAQINYSSTSAATQQSYASGRVTRYVPYAAVGISEEMTDNISVAVVGHATLAQGGFGVSTVYDRVPAFYGGTVELTYMF